MKKKMVCGSAWRQDSAHIIEENKLYENGRHYINAVDLVWWLYNQS